MIRGDERELAREGGSDYASCGAAPLQVGRILVTLRAAAVLSTDEIVGAIQRHAAGDWGDAPVEQRIRNDRALRERGSITSEFIAASEIRFTVITNAERTQTTVSVQVDSDEASTLDESVEDRRSEFLFSLGRVVTTPAALEAISSVDIVSALRRHAHGDWGDLDDEGRALSNRALAEGLTLLSAYRGECGVAFWILTTADRTTTTVLLPSDY